LTIGGEARKEGDLWRWDQRVWSEMEERSDGGGRSALVVVTASGNKRKIKV